MTDSKPETVTLLREPDNIEENQGEFSLTFQEPMCMSSALVGGKGSQLAMLTFIQRQVDASVPKGFCLTLSAFEHQVSESEEIKTSLSNIENAIRNGDFAILQGLCADAVELLASCKIAQPIESQLTSQVEAVFGKMYHDTRLAVRSSASGEDGSEASSAGQMETFLGVRGLNNLLDTIRKCWASAYAYQAVEYRRQHGQPVKTSMGVVIQEMVPSYVSGVLFTHDPMSGNPSKMVIDASYGLGETVVSGKATPDTYFIQRYYDGRLNILSKKLGNKDVEIQMSESDGVIEVTSGSRDTSQPCLSDEQVLKLCHVAIKIEAYFGSSRDIEWAIQDEQIYLLQARPITTTDQLSDEDIMHEFDSPLATSDACLTLGNIGEMMPGVVTPLTGSVFGLAVDKATMVVGLDMAGGHAVQNACSAVVSFCGRLFINLTATGQGSSNSVMFNKSALEMNLVGEILEDHTLAQILSYGHQKCNRNIFEKLFGVGRFFYVNRWKANRADTWHERLKTYYIGTDCQSAMELYQEIDAKLPDYYEVWETSVHISAQSGMSGGIIMGIVSGGKPEWTTENYSDVALLLSQCNNVYSAEVPTAMRELAKLIVTKDDENKFLALSETEAVDYLTSDRCHGDIRTKYDEFMTRHGHRCIREAEFIEKSWRAEPEKLIKVLKTILKAKAYEETQLSMPTLEEAVEQLQSPVAWLGKLILKKGLVNKARVAVGRREFGKSIAVQLSDRFKQAYWRLADLLYKEGRLPDKELTFYLTHHEIGRLLETRSAALVTKAFRRRKLLPVQADVEFPRLSKGRPQPLLKKNETKEREATFSVHGMPVSRGSVKGPAKVVKSLEEANQIKKGDILIVNYTDVGWSPYFPLIAGLVTEMGGLVSHGAVVAREYGLPCVVNVPGVTTMFSTGDYIHLDGTNGFIHRLQDKTNEEED